MKKQVTECVKFLNLVSWNNVKRHNLTKYINTKMPVVCLKETEDGFSIKEVLRIKPTMNLDEIYFDISFASQECVDACADFIEEVTVILVPGKKKVTKVGDTINNKRVLSLILEKDTLFMNKLDLMEMGNCLCTLIWNGHEAKYRPVIRYKDTYLGELYYDVSLTSHEFQEKYQNLIQEYMISDKGVVTGVDDGIKLIKK